MNQPKNNHRNDRVKRDYLIWLKEAKQRSDATVEQTRHAIDRLEAYTKFKDFATFNKEQAIGFKRTLLESKAQRTGKPISISTVHHTLQAIKEFLAWLHGQQKYRFRIKLADIAYLNLTTGEERQAHASSPKKYATLEEYRTALFAMPTETEIERRDQAIMALLMLTCMRDAAAISLKLKHINIACSLVFQDARQVKTKFRKTFETFFYPVGEDVEAIVIKWVDFLVNEKNFTDDDPLFPKTVNGHDNNSNFVPEGLGREHWANATAVRKMFRAAFERVGLPYVKPHSVRYTLTQLAYKLGLNAEELKAWSQNMGHNSVLTTIGTYGPISRERQAEIIGGLGKKPPAITPDDSMVENIARRVAAILGRTAS